MLGENFQNMIANIIYSIDKDKKLLELVPSNFPIFINFINITSGKDRKQAFRIKSKWGAKKNPFIEVLDEDGKVNRCFYSENNSAITQLIEWLNDSKNQKT